MTTTIGHTRAQEAELRKELAVVESVWPASPSPKAFVPLVLLLIVVIPCLNAWSHHWMTPNLAAWGLRGLDVLERGDWKLPGEPGRPTAPIIPWMHALVLAVPRLDPNWALLLPSCFLGVAACVMVVRLGWLWYSLGVGLTAGIIFACNGLFLEYVRLGHRGVVALFFALACLLAFSEHLERRDDVVSRWTFLGGIAMAGVLLSAGGLALWTGIVAGLVLIARSVFDRAHEWARLRHFVFHPTVLAGLAVILMGIAVASPWLATAGWNLGYDFPWVSPSITEEAPLGLPELFQMMPATIVLSVVAIVDALRRMWRKRFDPDQELFVMVWGTASLAWLATGSAPPMVAITAIAPLSLLSGRTLLGFLNRKLTDDTVLVAVLFTEACLILLRKENAIGYLISIVVAGVVLGGTALAFSLTRKNDRWRRGMLGTCIALLAIMLCYPGIRKLRTTDPDVVAWRASETRLQQLFASENPDSVVILSENEVENPVRYEWGTANIRFHIRSRLPQKAKFFFRSQQELAEYLGQTIHRPIVFLVGDAKRPPIFFQSAGNGRRTFTFAHRMNFQSAAVYTPVLFGSSS